MRDIMYYKFNGEIFKKCTGTFKLLTNIPYSIENPIRKINNIDLIVQPEEGLCIQACALMIENFLEDFYKTISFECGESFKSEKFKEFFLPNAVLMENNDGEYTQKTIYEHIAEFDVAIRDYPHLFVKGFHEVQTDYSVIENEECIMVSSKYQKNYCRNGEDITEYGTNNMIIIRYNNEYKIASILW